MYRKIVFFAALTILFSCQQAEDRESIKKQIAEYKLQIEELNVKVLDLEKKLDSIPSTVGEGFRVPVVVEQVDYSVFRHYIEVGGVVEAISEAFISPELSGQIHKIYVKEGARVTKGQLLAEISSEIIRSQIQEVENSLDYSKVVFEKQKRLWEQRIGSEIQYLNAKNNVENLESRLETLQAQLDMSTIKSPVNGVVDEIFKKEGELALPGVQMMQIVNLEMVYINADVSESYLSSIREGEPVEVTFPAYPDLKMEVPIHRKGNIINPDNRTFIVQLKMSNPDKLLKPNILSRIYINDFTSDTALVVPASLVKQDLKGNYVYVVDEDGKNPVARKAYIQTGLSYNNKTMVTQGISPGQKVIVTGYNQVADGTIVEIKSDAIS
jgi:RND family efflux transporter MFP subunit